MGVRTRYSYRGIRFHSVLDEPEVKKLSHAARARSANSQLVATNSYFCVSTILCEPTCAVSILFGSANVESIPRFGYLGLMYLSTKYCSAIRGTVTPSID